MIAVNIYRKKKINSIESLCRLEELTLEIRPLVRTKRSKMVKPITVFDIRCMNRVDWNGKISEQIKISQIDIG